MFRRILIRAIFSALGIFFAGLMLCLVTIHFGLVTGEEFAPDTFERRSYHYYELPLVRLKITPVMRNSRQNQLTSLLVNKQYIAQSTPPERWDLVCAQRGGRAWRQGPAQILCQYLDAWDPAANSASFWETWTTENPTLANVVWPEIANLARHKLYFLVPPVFDQALEHERPPVLQDALDTTLAHRYRLLAAAEKELGHLETAVRFYSNALGHQPGNTSSLQGRATCYEALGQSAKAAQDRQAIVTHSKQ